MKDITITFVPSNSLAAQGEPSKTFPFAPGMPMPMIGDIVTFRDPTNEFKVTAKSLHYVDTNTLQVFYRFERP